MQALQESWALEMLERADLGVLVIDPDGRVIQHSRAAAELLHYPEGTLHVGAHLTDLIRVYARNGLLGTAPEDQLVSDKLV